MRTRLTDSGDRTPVLVAAARTPIGRFGGALRDVDAVDLGATSVRAAIDRAGGLRPDHVYLGNVVQAGNGQNPARTAAVRAGLELTIPATTLNDVCLASMTAVGLAGTLIRAGEINTAVVGGFESMSRSLHGLAVRTAARLGDQPSVDLLVRDGLWCSLSNRGMGELSEDTTTALGISRARQDDYALQSHVRASEAQVAGRLSDEIDATASLPLLADEGIRPETTSEGLAGLRTAFRADGTITAGNASQMSDAAAAGVMTSRGTVRALGLRAIVEVVGRAVIAGPDTSLHLKPAAAARKLLDGHRLHLADVGLWEINEAFAGVVLASTDSLGLDPAIVNVNGGAISLGHPLGASGFRIIMSLAMEMRRRQVELGVAAICGGGGQGQAVLLRLS